jgi:hypothetical protein
VSRYSEGHSGAEITEFTCFTSTHFSGFTRYGSETLRRDIAKGTVTIKLAPPATDEEVAERRYSLYLLY